MKRLNAILLLLLAITSQAMAQKTRITGPQGNISYTLTLPKGFDPDSGQKCPMVILMHGIFSSKAFTPMPALARELAAEGIASIRFDFGGHGASAGRTQEMTVEKELQEAAAVWRLAESLPYVSSIGVLGHSQGGVIASMFAGRQAARGDRAPDALVLIAPGSVIKDACQAGRFFDARFDPANPPEFVSCWGLMRLGREYLVTTQDIDIYGTASSYEGPVLILHGDRDNIVPLWCSEQFVQTYGERSILEVMEGENHLISRRTGQIASKAAEFFCKELRGKEQL